MEIPTSNNRPPHLRECFCSKCGMVAPSWFHSDFIMFGGGFVCQWCNFPDREDLTGPKPTDRSYVPVPRF